MVSLCMIMLQIEFSNESNLIIREGKDRKTKYFFADPSVIVSPLRSPFNFPQKMFALILTALNCSLLLKASAVYQLPDLVAVGEAGVVKLVVRDKKNDTSNEYSINVGETDQEFNFNFKVENIKILPGTYEVVISQKLLAPDLLIITSI